MKDKPENPPAFPSSCTKDGFAPDHSSVAGGLSMRDYFAAHAPIDFETVFKMLEHAKNEAVSADEVMPYLAELRYTYADAMLKERIK